LKSLSLPGEAAVLDFVVGPPWEGDGEGLPPRADLSELPGEELLFLWGPREVGEDGIDVVLPSFAALPWSAIRHELGDGDPGIWPALAHSGDELLVFE
jgi:hypothetical protein